MFIAGRYEYRNKGVDVFIESLAREHVPIIVHPFSSLFMLPDRSQLPPPKIWFKDDRGCVHHHACCNEFLHRQCSQRASGHETIKGYRY